MTKHYNLKIYGRVIGVGYRWACREQAIRFNISGFVRNAGNGYVYIEAEGAEAGLESFLAWCHKGPFWAKVERVEKEEGKVVGYRGFEVHREQ